MGSDAIGWEALTCTCTASGNLKGLSSPGANVAALAVGVLFMIARYISAIAIREREEGCADFGFSLF